MEVAEIPIDKNWAILNKNPSWVPGGPRKAAVAHLRLLTGHDSPRSHIYKISITDSPDCTQVLINDVCIHPETSGGEEISLPTCTFSRKRRNRTHEEKRRESRGIAADWFG
ncbi:hypothetical protein TNCV_2292921 [Trichonephila clavipes]|nr:hypothetical protein TNCV_2292921 [Trichonephila clavipes]